MPSVEENYAMWNERYSWPYAGEEWSAPWGGADLQWERTILPRIRSSLPTHTILEIAPGFGRFTRFLAEYCERLIAVDLSPRCVSVCSHRLQDLPNVTILVNDGLSLPMIEDGTIDFLFSWDSLVHAEPDAIGSYLREARRVLCKTGCGFIHHSNLGQYASSLPSQPERGEHWRSRMMDANVFRALCDHEQLACTGQELVNWRDAGRLLDCFSWFEHAGAAHTATVVKENWQFMREAGQGWNRWIQKTHGTS